MIKFIIGLLLTITLDVPTTEPFLALFAFSFCLMLMVWGIKDIMKEQKYNER